MKITLIMLMMVMMIPLTSFGQEAEQEYHMMAWHQFKSGRICFEAHDGAGMLPGFEKCIKVQSACKLIYDGISTDPNRKWMTETEGVKSYFQQRGLTPIDYLHVLNIMSKEQSKPKE